MTRQELCRRIGKCRVCGHFFTLKQDGTLWHHVNSNAPKTGVIFSPRCEGAGCVPEETTDASS